MIAQLISTQFEHAAPVRLIPPSVESTSGVTLGGSTVDAYGQRSPEDPQPLAWGNNSIIEVPSASAVLVHLSK
jgi:hypothetical protein